MIYSVIFLMGLSFLGGMAHYFHPKVKQRGRRVEKGMELKDGGLFVIFSQFIKGFVLGQADETCDSWDCRAHRPRKNLAR